MNRFAPPLAWIRSSLASRPIPLLLLGLAALPASFLQAGQTLHVAPDPSDRAEGTVEEPLGLAAALRRAESDASITEIVLAGGMYFLEEGIVLKGLDRHNGPALLVRAAENAKPVVSGGVALGPGWHAADSEDPIVTRMPPEARDRVQVVELSDHGISDFGKLQMQGFTERRIAPGELFLGFERAPVAGWPNIGEDRDDATAKIENGHWVYGELADGKLPLPPEKAELWQEAEDLWAHGYWGTDWADFHLPVGVVDGGLLPSEAPHFGLKKNGAVRVYNLPEELDQPGEWYLEPESSRLYLWPRSQVDLEDAVYSRLDEPLLRLEDSHNIAFLGIAFAHGRGALARLDDDSTQITFADCHFHSSGLEAIRVDGVRNEIVNCRFRHIGESAIVLGGGDKATLKRARNHVIGNVISQYGERYYSYSAGAEITGVGNVFANNHVFDAPHEAVQVNGNLHLVYRNNIHDVCQYSDDAGAIYSGRDWSGWGNRIIENFIHDIRTRRGSRKWVHGLYLDDCASGFIVRRNIFLRIDGFGTNLGGGRSNLIEHNYFAHCLGAHLNDNRGSKWIEAKPGSSWNPFEALEKVPFREEPWLSTFPALAELPEDFDEAAAYFLPIGNTFIGNAGIHNEKWADFVDWTGDGVEEHYAAYDAIPLKVIHGNAPADWRPGDPKKDFKLEDGTVIPFSEMGIRGGR